MSEIFFALLEREGVEAEHEGAAGIVPGQHAREVEHLPELPLPEPDEVEPLKHHQVPWKVAEMPGHRGLGVVHLALDQEGDRLDVAALPQGLGGGGGPRPLRRLPGLDEPLVQEQADGKARVSEGEPGIRRRCGAEAVERLGVPAEQAVHRPVVRLERVARRRGGRQAVRVRPHGRHASRRPDARRAPRPGIRPRGAPPMSRRATASAHR